MVLFFVTPCLVVAVQPCIEWIPTKKSLVECKLWKINLTFMFSHVHFNSLMLQVAHAIQNANANCVKLLKRLRHGKNWSCCKTQNQILFKKEIECPGRGLYRLLNIKSKIYRQSIWHHNLLQHSKILTPSTLKSNILIIKITASRLLLHNKKNMKTGT